MRDKQLFADSVIPTHAVSPFQRHKTISARIVICGEQTKEKIATDPIKRDIIRWQLPLIFLRDQSWLKPARCID